MLAARWIAELAVPLISSFGEPVTLDVSLDWRMITFAIGAGLGATILAGVAPVIGIFRASPAGALGEGGRSASSAPATARTRRGLIVVQFALSLALVMAAALLARTVHNLRSIPTGFDIDRVALVSVDPGAAPMDNRRAAAYIESALDAVSPLPGVQAAGFGRVIPLGFGGARRTVAVPGYEPAADEDMELNYNTISPAYFDAMGIAFADGRPFDDRDRAGSAPVVIVNETMAARYWPNTRAVGQRLVIDPGAPALEVVGVARNVKYRMLREEAGPSFYLPLSQNPARDGVIHIRTAGDPSALLPVIRRTLAEVNPAVPLTGVRTLREQATLNLNDERVAMLIGLTLGIAALTLAAVGLYGSMAYAVSQRKRELGVRIALGATAADIRRLVLGQGLAMSCAGTVLGIGVGVILARSLENRFFGVTAVDVPTMMGSAGVLAAVALLASWMPARRAAKVDPVDALRV
jgi:predicted permease